MFRTNNKIWFDCIYLFLFQYKDTLILEFLPIDLLPCKLPIATAVVRLYQGQGHVLMKIKKLIILLQYILNTPAHTYTHGRVEVYESKVSIHSLSRSPKSLSWSTLG